MDNKARILLIEDEASIRKVLTAGLKDSFDIIEATNGREGLQYFDNYSPDLVILDLGLPDIPGLEIVVSIRKNSKSPIVILSARGQEQDKIEVLDAGADDYLTKPFAIGELKARIRVSLRHAVQQSNPDGALIFENGALKIDFTSRQVFLDGEELKFTPTEYRLLSLLATNAGKVVTHQQLLTTVWGAAFKKQTQYLRVYLGQLRQKLKDNPDRPKLLITEPGVGYRLQFIEPEI